ncbi:hypothetical protein Psyc_1033 [Psychrobacter arcticus 273-4]|uniref:Uncharacterized protein n=1 Tax=Psychrobacter arcticus (strain DSM 17307 / VKM B-2377 / 273-4) TaxID=259536 RepID=Q4FSX2_PSYA2|nr:hypothetical protein [Psychrobacter arcticus]AAZ18886.1 hypothetical protein Psyc_1033 [Psychrobacter arcticus 273-4]
MNLILLLKFWREIAITVLIIALLAVWSLYASRGDAIKQIKTDHELQLTTLKANYVETARQIERQAYEQTIQAANDAKAREQVIIADAASARDAVASLSDTIDKLSANAAADANFRIEYSRTTGNLLKECSGQYISMAETADRIANDLRAIQSANKR